MWEKDRVVVEVRAVERAAQATRVLVRLKHDDYREDRDWSFCDLVVALGADQTVPEVGDRVFLVLGSRATVAELASGGGYSCRVKPGSERPVFPVERASPGGHHVGLVQREEPPNQGAVLLHMGSGLTCYPDLDDAAVDLKSIQDGSFWELVFPGDHRALCWEVID